MAIIQTYVCDASGKTGSVGDFINVSFSMQRLTHTAKFLTVPSFTKLIHIDVARKLNLVLPPKGEEAQPEPTLESKLLVLLKEYIVDIAYEAGGEAGAEAASNRN